MGKKTFVASAAEETRAPTSEMPEEPAAGPSNPSKAKGSKDKKRPRDHGQDQDGKPKREGLNRDSDFVSEYFYLTLQVLSGTC